MAAEESPGEARETAPAKVNLFLHVLGRRADGRHELESLVVFPAVADRLAAQPADELSLTVTGPFAAALAGESDNLVLRAARLLRETAPAAPGAALVLEKHLPVAAGIGGGSADAAATLRLLARLWRVDVPPALPARLGADVPVCMEAPAPKLVAGAGERLGPAPALPGFWMVLANPRVAVSTPAVFAALRRRSNPPAGPLPRFASFADLIGWLARQRNDLEDAARGLCPAVGEVLEALARTGTPVARMSGSGATCFALWPDEASARRAAERLSAAHASWWVAAAPVAPWRGAA